MPQSKGNRACDRSTAETPPVVSQLITCLVSTVDGDSGLRCARVSSSRCEVEDAGSSVECFDQRFHSSS